MASIIDLQGQPELFSFGVSLDSGLQNTWTGLVANASGEGQECRQFD